MDQALLYLAALGAVVWIIIFAAAKMSVAKVAEAKNADYNQRLARLLEDVTAEEESEPPLPNMSLKDVIQREIEVQRNLSRGVRVASKIPISSTVFGAHPTKSKVESN